MKILVIGSEGNIGEPLVAHLRSVGHEVYATDIRPGFRDNYAMADINHPLDLLDAFDWGPEVVYLMAAVVSRVTCEQSPSLAITTNLAGTQNVLTLARRAGARVVFFSTSEVYGPTDGRMYEDAIPRPNNRYGLTKWLGEQLVAYEAANGLVASVVRPFMIYSEDEALGDHRSAMIRFAQNLSAGRAIDVHTGSARGWLHMSDAVIALERMADLAVRSYQIVNIGHPDIIETVELAELIRERLGAPAYLVRTIAQPERMTPVKYPALAKQERLLGMVPAVSLVDGVYRVCDRFAPVHA